MSKRAKEAAENIGYIGISYKAVKIFKEGVKAGYEQAEKETIERAARWIMKSENQAKARFRITDDEFIEFFRKAMEEE